MNDNWEVKQVTKVGENYNILVGPVDNGLVPVVFVCAITLALGIMHLFDLTGFAWGIGLFLIGMLTSYFLFWPTLIVTAIILIGFFAG